VPLSGCRGLTGMFTRPARPSPLRRLIVLGKPGSRLAKIAKCDKTSATLTPQNGLETPMAIASTAVIHSSAVVDPRAEIGEHVRIGPGATIDGAVTIGPECIIGPNARLVGELVMGRGNKVYAGAVIGEDPQHLGYNGQPTKTVIGDSNTFREYVTIHRGSHVEGATTIGNHCYFMVNCHIGHDSQIANHVIVVNGSLVAGHCRIGDRVFVSGNCCLHQFVRVGRFSMLGGLGAINQDVIPFVTVETRGKLSGLNLVGLKRAGFTSDDLKTLKKAFHILFLTEELIGPSIQRLEAEMGTEPLVREILDFIAGSKRGLMRNKTNRYDAD
jgi:UDP-N-acetylglucosamine acyltransferase